MTWKTAIRTAKYLELPQNVDGTCSVTLGMVRHYSTFDIIRRIANKSIYYQAMTTWHIFFLIFRIFFFLHIYKYSLLWSPLYLRPAEQKKCLQKNWENIFVFSDVVEKSLDFGISVGQSPLFIIYLFVLKFCIVFDVY